MKKRIMAVLTVVSLFFVLGIVGSVEQGAHLARLLWTAPGLFVLTIGIAELNQT